MHDGAFATLADVVRYYDRGGRDNTYLDARIRPLGLSDRDVSDLVALLESLQRRRTRRRRRGGVLAHRAVHRPRDDATLCAGRWAPRPRAAVRRSDRGAPSMPQPSTW